MTLGQTWWSISIIPALRRLGWEDHKLQASLGYKDCVYMCMHAMHVRAYICKGTTL